MTRWYEERPESEEEWRGELRRCRVLVSPGGRNRLLYELALVDGPVRPIYGPDVEQRLSRLVGKEVVVVAKLVDLTAEGFGPELWVADESTVQPARARSS